VQSSAFAQSEVVDTDYEKGNILNGYKEGIWEYYDADFWQLALKIDYSKGNLLYQKPDTSTYVVYLDGEWKKMKLDQTPRYIGSMHDFVLVSNKIRYPVKARNRQTVGSFNIIFEVDSLGKAGEFKVLNDIGDGCGEEALDKLFELPNYWIPAKLNGQNLASRFTIPITFSMVDDGRTIKPRKKSIVSEIPIAKALDEITVSLVGVRRESNISIPQNQSVYQVTMEMPKFPGGTDSLYKYLSENVQSPDESVQGKSKVKFDVDVDGSLDNIEIIKSLGPAFDLEVTRLISNMPNWIPGTQNGRSIKTSMKLSVDFKNKHVRGK